MPVNPKQIESIIAEVTNEYGKGIIHKGSEHERAPRIPFPSHELNMATGGGTPIGKVSRLWGDYHSTKTFTCLNLIRNAQNLHLFGQQFLESPYDEVKQKGQYILDKFPQGLEVAYYNVEGVWDDKYAQEIGIDTDRVLVIDEHKIEPIAKIVEASMGAVHLHIIDSASAAASVDEVKADIDDWQRALKARVWGKVLDHWKEHFDLNENAIVLIDQSRIDQKFGSEKPPGGRSISHASDQTIKFRRGAWLYRREGILKDTAPNSGDTIHGGAEADGMEITAQVLKSRVGRPLRVARMQLEFTSSAPKWNLNYELAKAAQWFETVKKSGSWFDLPDGSKAQGIGQLSQAFDENPDLKKATQDEIERYIVQNP